MGVAASRRNEAGVECYAAFIRANPDWPSIPLLRRRAEVRLSQGPRYAASMRRFLAEEPTGSVNHPRVKQEVRTAQDSDESWRERRGLLAGLSISATQRPPIGWCASCAAGQSQVPC